LLTTKPCWLTTLDTNAADCAQYAEADSGAAISIRHSGISLLRRLVWRHRAGAVRSGSGEPEGEVCPASLPAGGALPLACPFGEVNLTHCYSFASTAQTSDDGDWLGCAQALIGSGAPPPDAHLFFLEEIAAFFSQLRRCPIAGSRSLCGRDPYSTF
jgi:hypothetical protein